MYTDSSSFTDSRLSLSNNMMSFWAVFGPSNPSLPSFHSNSTSSQSPLSFDTLTLCIPSTTFSINHTNLISYPNDKNNRISLYPDSSQVKIPQGINPKTVKIKAHIDSYNTVIPDYLTLTISSKIINQNNPTQGITIDNIPEVFENIAKIGIVDIPDIAYAISQTTIKRADVFHHYAISIQDSFSAIKSSRSLKHNPYNKTASSLCVESTIKRDNIKGKARLICYDKAREMQDKQKSNWRKIRDNEIGKQCLTTSRYELQLSTLQAIRYYLMVGSPKKEKIRLLDVLCSQSNPIQKYITELQIPDNEEGHEIACDFRALSTPATIEEYQKWIQIEGLRTLYAITGGTACAVRQYILALSGNRKHKTKAWKNAVSMLGLTR